MEPLLIVFGLLFLLFVIGSPFLSSYLIKRYTALKGGANLLAVIALSLVIAYILFFIGFQIIFAFN